MTQASPLSRLEKLADQDAEHFFRKVLPKERTQAAFLQEQHAYLCGHATGGRAMLQILSEQENGHPQRTKFTLYTNGFADSEPTEFCALSELLHAKAQEGIAEFVVGDLRCKLSSMEKALASSEARVRELEKALEAINTPEIHDFLKAVENEAKHQRLRWASDHDAGKTDADWFWLIGYLAGKAINKPEKMLHHIITTAAACLNWHAARVGTSTKMRPGIEPPDEALLEVQR